MDLEHAQGDKPTGAAVVPPHTGAAGWIPFDFRMKTVCTHPGPRRLPAC
jgi:hypothetical protein